MAQQLKATNEQTQESGIPLPVALAQRRAQLVQEREAHIAAANRCGGGIAEIDQLSALLATATVPDAPPSTD